MKRIALFLFATFLFGTTFAQDKQASQTIQTGHLYGVSAHSGFEVTLTQGTTSRAVISIDSRLEPYLNVHVRDGILELNLNQFPLNLQLRKLARKAEVTVNGLQTIEAHSGAEIVGSGSFTADHCTIEAQSGAQITGITLTAKSVTVNNQSGADITLSGETESLTATASSGSDTNLANLKALSISASASSGSDLSCWPTQSLDASASSGASIRFRGGRLTNTHLHSSSGGSIRPIREK